MKFLSLAWWSLVWILIVFIAGDGPCMPIGLDL